MYYIEVKNVSQIYSVGNEPVVRLLIFLLLLKKVSL